MSDDSELTMMYPPHMLANQLLTFFKHWLIDHDGGLDGLEVDNEIREQGLKALTRIMGNGEEVAGEGDENDRRLVKSIMRCGNMGELSPGTAWTAGDYAKSLAYIADNWPAERGDDISLELVG